MATLLVCPECLQGDQLGTIEVITGVAALQVLRSDDGKVEQNYSGSTDMDWDSSKTVGVECKCDFFYRGTDWVDQLVALPSLEQIIAVKLTTDDCDPEDVQHFIKAAAELDPTAVANPRVRIFAELITTELGDLSSVELANTGVICDIADIIDERRDVVDAALADAAS